MEDQYRWKRFDDSVRRELVPFARAGRANPYGRGAVRCERVFNFVY